MPPKSATAFAAASDPDNTGEWAENLTESEAALSKKDETTAAWKITKLGQSVGDSAGRGRVWLMQLDRLAALSARSALSSIADTLKGQTQPEASLVTRAGPAAFFKIIDSEFDQNPLVYLQEPHGPLLFNVEIGKSHVLKIAFMQWLARKADESKEESPLISFFAGRRASVFMHETANKTPGHLKDTQALLASALLHSAKKLVELSRHEEAIHAARLSASWAENKTPATDFLLQMIRPGGAPLHKDKEAAGDALLIYLPEDHSAIEEVAAIILEAVKLRMQGKKSVQYGDPGSPFFEAAKRVKDRAPFTTLLLEVAQNDFAAYGLGKRNDSSTGVWLYRDALKDFLPARDPRAITAIETLLTHAAKHVDEFSARIAAENTERHAGAGSELDLRAKALHQQIVEASKPSLLGTRDFLKTHAPETGKLKLDALLTLDP